MTEAADYRAIFSSIESTLIRVGNEGGRKDNIRHRLDYFKMVQIKPSQTPTTSDCWFTSEELFYGIFRRSF
jgi:hypothetical protein